ncbi:MAG: hypothetical protein GX890_07110 [Firmicutes bacterium]|nr:hypothetical protein [Bacillota bacterium]HPU00415.1 hypothetical protein [Bacillota bacterium]
MPLRAVFFNVLFLLLCLAPPQPAGDKDPWLEMEKGLRPYHVENISYRYYCFIDKSERERILALGVEQLNGLGEAPAESGLFLQEGYENGEMLLLVRGRDRQACLELRRRLEAVISRPPSAQAWSVEAYLEGRGDLELMGTGLARALGGRIQSIHAGPRMVQLLAYLPWAGEGLPLDEGAVNLQLELYRPTSSSKLRIRLGIPVLPSVPF